MMGFDIEQTQFDFTTPADITCPRCSQRLSDLNETYFVGCSECYKVFAPYIRDLATKYHGRCVHTGKIYERKRNRASIEKEMAELAREEKQAVLEKNYLRADEVHRKLLALLEVLDGSC